MALTVHVNGKIVFVILQMPAGKDSCMTRILAEFSAFDEGERAFRRALRDFESVLDSMENSLGRSLSEWDGDAKRTYLEAHARWDQSARELHKRLARLHQAIQRTHRNFHSSSRTNVQMWSE